MTQTSPRTTTRVFVLYTRTVMPRSHYIRTTSDPLYMTVQYTLCHLVYLASSNCQTLSDHLLSMKFHLPMAQSSVCHANPRTLGVTELMRIRQFQAPASHSLLGSYRSLRLLHVMMFLPLLHHNATNSAPPPKSAILASFLFTIPFTGIPPSPCLNRYPGTPVSSA